MPAWPAVPARSVSALQTELGVSGLELPPTTNQDVNLWHYSKKHNFSHQCTSMLGSSSNPQCSHLPEPNHTQTLEDKLQAARQSSATLAKLFGSHSSPSQQIIGILHLTKPYTKRRSVRFQEQPMKRKWPREILKNFTKKNKRSDWIFLMKQLVQRIYIQRTREFYFWISVACYLGLQRCINSFYQVTYQSKLIFSVPLGKLNEACVCQWE